MVSYLRNLLVKLFLKLSHDAGVVAHIFNLNTEEVEVWEFKLFWGCDFVKKGTNNKNITPQTATPLNYLFTLIKINVDYIANDYLDMGKKVWLWE